VRHRLLALVGAGLALALAVPPGMAAPLRAGAGRAVIAVPDGAPLAGYGSLRRRLWFPDILDLTPNAFWFRPHRGALAPLAVRALVFERGATRLVWVAADLIAVDAAFTAAVRARLGGSGPPPALVVSASHTHSGPGAFLRSRLMGIVATDRHARPVKGALLGAVVQAVRDAERATGPAQLRTATVTAPPVVVSRLGQPLDDEIVVLRVTRPSGAPVALLWNYAIHGTMLGPSNLRLSGDVMGIASAALEDRLGVPVLYVNGAVGDVSPRHHGLTAARADGLALARAVAEGWERSGPAPARLGTRTASVDLPAPRLSLQNCLGRLVPSALTVSLARSLPVRTELVAGTIGDVAWVSIPGELQTSLGRTVKAAETSGRGRAMLAGLSNDYLGYFTAAEDYARVTYVTCASLYGVEGGERLAAAAAALIRAASGTDQR
jgi:hypothetical protein